MDTCTTTDNYVGVDTRQQNLTAATFKGTTAHMSTETVSLREFIARELALVKEVEAVLTARQDNELHVWIVVNEFDSSVRERIYERERAIIDEVPSMVFDFNILSRRNRRLEEIAQDPSLQITYRR